MPSPDVPSDVPSPDVPSPDVPSPQVPMPAAAGSGHGFEAIAFLSSGTPEADHARDAYAARYGSVAEHEADVVVALGGDGMMLQTLHRFMDKRVPIFGINHGSVGFLMNEWRDIDLRERIAAAQPSVIHPLVMRATSAAGEMSEGARSTRCSSRARPIRR